MMPKQKHYFHILVIAMLIFACDESGRVEYEHLGKWQLYGDSTIYPESRTYTPISDYTSNSSYLEFFDDLKYEALEVNELGDTIYQYLGRWRLSLNALTLNYEVGPQRVFDLLVKEDELSLVQTSYYYRYVHLYHRVGQ